MQPSTPPEPSALGTLVFIMWGAIVWGLQLTAVYVGTHGSARCARRL
jgi:hypothetical protein